ncbi:QsdR family transcriptional regulator [Streptomyces sp. NBC_01381]|uniref:QsdR family transcriptional regulator n=1 Tax=Streptomyces sp. NBC_01381 TaxID=2903845 RepID=UPI00225BC120|nr:QsdR family transcriptional regulator [Streptomyces sp. NBC_01381]MCX4671653.1 QsdR family transcriptional regulator [Streptomyces sp. NBC_01381]
MVVVAETPLTRHLAAGKVPRRSPRDAFEFARRRYLAGERVDMQDLAAELGISRATLFRWVGNRDQLIAEVIWSFTEPALERAAAAAPGRGGARIAAIVETFTRGIIDADYFHTFVSREPEASLRLLTMRASVVQRRIVVKIQELLQEEVDRGALDPPMALPDLAYVITRIGESFVYADLITGDQPDATKPAAAVAALLR